MKNRILNILPVIFWIAIASCPLQVSAQSQTVGYDPNKDDYKFKNGAATDNVHKEYIDEILNKKMKLLQRDLVVLTEKKEPGYMNTIDKAMQLFNNDESVLVTVTNKNTGKVFIKPIKEYLMDVAKLPYKTIKISYRNYTTISNIRKQPDGTFKGVAVLQQEFTGFDKEGNAMYHDVIKRNVEVNVKITDYGMKDNEKVDEVSIDVFFGNMGVTEA